MYWRAATFACHHIQVLPIAQIQLMCLLTVDALNCSVNMITPNAVSNVIFNGSVIHFKANDCVIVSRQPVKYKLAKC